MEENLTLKKIFDTAKEYFREIAANYKILLFFIVIFVAYFAYEALTVKPVYASNLTFMINENEGGISSGGAAASILGSLGISGGSGEYQLDKILQLAKSNRIIHEALFSKDTIFSKDDFFINHIIEVYNFDNTEWKDDDSMRGLRFKSNVIEKLNRNELTALKGITSRIIGSGKVAGMLTTTYKKESSIMTMELKSESEKLSISFVKKIFDVLSRFYVKKAVEKQQYTFDVVVAKADSLKGLLYGKEYAQAAQQDRSRGLFMETYKVPVQRLSRDVSMLTVMYSEAIKNAELADFALKNKTPFIQPIDLPIAPLYAVKPSLKRAILVGIALGFFIAFMFIVIRKVLREAISNSIKQ